MKADMEIVLEGSIRLPVSCKVDSLADVSKLGAKLQALARNTRRMFPDFAGLPVKRVSIKTTGE